MGRPRKETTDEYPSSSAGQRGPDGKKLDMRYPKCFYCKGKLSPDDFVLLRDGYAHSTCHEDATW